MMAEVGEDRIGASTYIKEYFKSKGELSPAYIAAASCINAPNETRGGIMSTFRTKTRIFSSQEALSEMLSYSDFDIRDIGKEKTAVFLKVHDEKTTYHALATIFVKQAYEALIATAQTFPNLKLPYRTNFILDEFANMPALKDVETMITASRSRNIRFSFVIQNFSQLNKVYGKDVAETIKGNCGNFVYIMSTELAALEEISKLLGDQKPAKAEKDKPAPPIRPLFTVSDLQALKEGEVIINRFRSMPFKTKLTFDYKTDWGKKYPLMDYTERPKRGVKVFDLKGYVTKMKGEQTEPSGMGMMGGGMPPYMPAGMAMMGGARPAAPSPMPTSMDDYIKRLDEKIAELEKQEAEEKAQAEREKQAASANNATGNLQNSPVVDTVPLTEKSEEDLEKEISDIFGHKVEEPHTEPVKPEPVKEVPIYEEEKKDKISDIDFNKFIVPMPEEIEEDEYDFKKPVTQYEQAYEEPIKVKEPEKEPEITEIPRFTSPFNHTNTEPVKTEPVSVGPMENIEKPKVNIDVDSVVVNNKPNDEDFFDDFFGSEDE